MQMEQGVILTFLSNSYSKTAAELQQWVIKQHLRRASLSSSSVRGQDEEVSAALQFPPLGNANQNGDPNFTIGEAKLLTGKCA